MVHLLVVVSCVTPGYECTEQFENLRNFEIALCKLEIANQFRKRNPISKLGSEILEYEYVFVNCTPGYYLVC